MANKPTYEQIEQRLKELEKSIEHANRTAVETEVASLELKQIFNTAADGMRVIDMDFNVLRTNKTFAALSGTSEAEAENKKCFEGFPSHMCDTDQCPLSRIVGGEERIECEVEKVRSDGSTIPCLVTATPFRGLDGELIGVVENCRDVTELKRAQAERLKMERLQGVLEMAGAVCHELNQPMQAVSGYCDLLMADMSQDGPVNGDLERIKVQIDRMGAITKKLMRITRYETKSYLEGSKIIDIDKASREAK